MPKRGEFLCLQTERLQLMPMTAEAMEDLVKRVSKGKPLMQMAAEGWPSSQVLEVLPTFAAKLKKAPSHLGWYVWTVIHPDVGAIGSMGFGGKPNAKGEIVLGYEIVPQYRQKGYATEAVSELVKWAFSKIAVKRIVAFCPEDNIPSVKILTRLGMQRVEQVEEPELPNSQVWKWEITRQQYRK